VTTVVVARNGADAHACFGGTDPASSPAGATLPRGTVLTIFSQLRESEPVDCRPEPTGEPPPSGS
jgi:hypothetical protein